MKLNVLNYHLFHKVSMHAALILTIHMRCRIANSAIALVMGASK